MRTALLLRSRLGRNFVFSSWLLANQLLFLPSTQLLCPSSPVAWLAGTKLSGRGERTAERKQTGRHLLQNPENEGQGKTLVSLGKDLLPSERNSSFSTMSSASSSTPLAEYKVVFITYPKESANTEARNVEAFAGDILKGKLGACVNIVGGVKSLYEWQDKIETDQEYLLVVKTRAELVEPLTVFVRLHHPYDCPEVIAMDITGGSPDYLKWITEVTTRSEKGLTPK